MNPERLLGNQNFELLEGAKQVPLELGDKTSAALTAKIEDPATLPNDTKRKFSLLRGQAAKMGQEPPLDPVKEFAGKGSAVVVG
ncbi:MAG TPA: hypothetical protein VJ783_05515 [Pirellulales bacterium]|nr:hypothetical protein [Pirellulales bacterium]